MTASNLLRAVRAARAAVRHDTAYWLNERGNDRDRIADLGDAERVLRALETMHGRSRAGSGDAFDAFLAQLNEALGDVPR